MDQVGNQHPDRDTQFRHINDTGQAYMEEGEPVISNNTRKKKNVGNFKNSGSEYRKRSVSGKYWIIIFQSLNWGK